MDSTKRKALNVQVEAKLFERMQRMKTESGAKTWQDFFVKIVHGEVDIYCEIIEVDGKPAKDHTVLFKLGEWTYKWERGEITLMSRPTVFTRLSTRYGETQHKGATSLEENSNKSPR